MTQIDSSDGKWRDDFARGFVDAAPDGFDAEHDAQAATPWQAPWTWDYEQNYALHTDGYEAGRLYVDSIRRELVAIITEEQLLGRVEIQQG